MKQSVSIKLENRNNIEDLNKIYLIPDGGWYRLYEWSLYLIEIIPSKRNLENKNLKVTKKTVSELNDGLIMSGIQEISFPNYLLENFETKKIEFEGTEVLVVDVSDFVSERNFTLENYKDVLKEFKERFNFTDTTKKKVSNKAQKYDSNCSDKTLVDNIMSFSIFEHTPLECYNFIQTLQKQIINDRL
jgi:hypothetical protein